MIAALFPGQGSQAVGMGRFLVENFKIASELFEEASDTLSIDFRKLCFDGPEADLQLTENTQPALLLVSTCSHQVAKHEIGLNFSAAAGHSIGEYAAVVAGEVISFAEAIQAVRERGLAMQKAVPVGEGGMLAVLGLEDDQVEFICEKARKDSGIEGCLEPANFNSPGQVVLSGHQEMIDWVTTNIKAEDFETKPRRMKLIPLKVSAPFHCSLMKPAEERMAEVLGQFEFKNSSLPIVQNVNAEPVTDGSNIRDNLIAQVTAPVKWVQCVKSLKAAEVNTCVELGSGKVLQGLVKKIDSDSLKTFNMQSLEDIKILEAELKG